MFVGVHVPVCICLKASKCLLSLSVCSTETQFLTDLGAASPPPPPVSPSHSAELQAHVTTLLGFELGSLRLRSKLFIHWTMSSAHVLTVWFLSSLLLSPFLGNSRQCILLTFTPFSQPLSDLTHPSLLTQVCVLFNVSLLVSFCHWLALQFICALQFACYLSARGKDTLLAFYFWRLDPKL